MSVREFIGGTLVVHLCATVNMKSFVDEKSFIELGVWRKIEVMTFIANDDEGRTFPCSFDDAVAIF